jgi:anti-sigma factor RsiW
MTAPSRVPDGIFHAYVDGLLAPRAEREVMQVLERDPAGAARAAAWRRHSDALRSAFDPIAEEPLPLSVMLKVRASYQDRPWDPVALWVFSAFLGGLLTGFAAAWLVYS